MYLMDLFHLLAPEGLSTPRLCGSCLTGNTKFSHLGFHGYQLKKRKTQECVIGELRLNQDKQRASALSGSTLLATSSPREDGMIKTNHLENSF